MGCSRKNLNRRGGWGYIFLKKNPPGIFGFVTLPLEILEKTSFHPLETLQNCVTDSPLEIPRPKTKTLPMEIPHGFFLKTLGNSTSFLIGPRNFHMLFLQYPCKFIPSAMMFSAPLFGFLWNIAQQCMCTTQVLLGYIYILDLFLNISKLKGK